MPQLSIRKTAEQIAIAVEQARRHERALIVDAMIERLDLGMIRPEAVRLELSRTQMNFGPTHLGSNEIETLGAYILKMWEQGQ